MLADPLNKISELTKIPINSILELFANITAFPVLNEQGVPQNNASDQQLPPSQQVQVQQPDTQIRMNPEPVLAVASSLADNNLMQIDSNQQEQVIAKNDVDEGQEANAAAVLPPVGEAEQLGGQEQATTLNAAQKEQQELPPANPVGEDAAKMEAPAAPIDN